jgi:hypothetical protein
VTGFHHHPEELIVLQDRDLDHALAPWFIGLAKGLTAVINNQKIINRKVDMLMSDQEQLDADVQALNAGLDAVEAELAALKAQPPAAALDFSGLDNAVARVRSDAPNATPPDTTAPVSTEESAPADATDVSTAPDTTGV